MSLVAVVHYSGQSCRNDEAINKKAHKTPKCFFGIESLHCCGSYHDSFISSLTSFLVDDLFPLVGFPTVGNPGNG